MQHTPSRRFTLQVHISTVLLALLVLVGSAMAWLAYSRSTHILEEAVQDVAQRVVREARTEWQGLLTPAESTVSLLGEQRLVKAHNLEERLDSLGFGVRALEAAPASSALYVAYPNGDFFLLRRVNDAQEIERLKAPAATRFAVQSIERDAVADVATFMFFDAQQQLLAQELRPDYARYDARQREWYQLALVQGGVVRTPPYVFFTNRKQGLTLARRAAAEGVVVGMDIELDTLNHSLGQQRVTPGSELVLFDERQQVLAAAVSATLPTEPARQQPPRLPALVELKLPVISTLVAQGVQAPYDAKPRALLVAERAWHGVAVPLSVDGQRQVLLALAVPDDELLAGARALRSDLLLTMAAVLLVALPVCGLMARQISRPLHLLARRAGAIQRFDFSQDEDVRSWVSEVDELALTMEGMKRTIRRFLDISATVASEDNFDRLLPKLLDEMVEAGDSAGGLLFLADASEQQLELVTLAHLGQTRSLEQPIQLARTQLPILLQDAMAAADTTALSGRVSVAELQALGDALWPELVGRMDHSAIAVPLFNRHHKLVGALLLLDARRRDEAMLSFVSALSGTASVSLETRELAKSQKELFESFIRMIASAIDAKSPYTGGHCARVPELTKMLARAACESKDGAFADFRLDDDQWEAVHVAAWLHDCGKMTTPEYVVDKSTKLETLYDRIHEVRMRFEVLKRDAEIRMWKAVVAGDELRSAHERLQHELAELDHEYRLVAMCNEGEEFLSPERIARLHEIGARTWMRTLDDRIGISREEKQRKAATPAPELPVAERLLADKPEHLIPRTGREAATPGNAWGFKPQGSDWLYNRGELANLGVAKGTLTPEERAKINEHIEQTIVMLSQLPFPKHLQSVPEMAGAHHEKMDGSGYPRGLRREDMSPVARMMAVADVFEALTAVDRPYKEGKTLSESVRILSFMARDGHIDPDVFELFLRSGVYLLYAHRFMKPELIDKVDLGRYLTPEPSTQSVV